MTPHPFQWEFLTPGVSDVAFTIVDAFAKFIEHHRNDHVTQTMPL